MDNHSKIVAAFDFDGTISYRDTLIFFFFYAFGALTTFLKLFLLGFQLIGFPFGFISRTEAKQRVLAAFLKGMKISSVDEIGKEFSHGPLKFLLRAKAITKLKWHQDQGHTCILISANFSFLIYPWADLMGFDYKIATEAAVDQEGKITGKLMGENCWGEEKVKRLKDLIGSKKDYVLYAYGDSRGDRELLAYADYPHYRPFT